MNLSKIVLKAINLVFTQKLQIAFLRHALDKVKEWNRLELALEPEALKPKHTHRNWTTDEKYQLVCKVLSRKSYMEVAVNNGLKGTQIRNWVRKYNELSNNELDGMRKGRPPKNLDMKKKNYNNPSMKN